jgi:hypothetical protein
VQLTEPLCTGSLPSKGGNQTEKDICELVNAGFEYVTDFEGAKIFRKTKTVAKTQETSPVRTPCLLVYIGAGGGI